VIRTVGVVGARPNFMKMAPVHRAMVGSGLIDPYLVHTGQHYDRSMTQVFIDELGLPQPDRSLEVGSGTHAEQTARIMLRLEPILVERGPDVVVVVGDVNSTLAGALTAAKLDIPVAHVEAGLRSFDRTMPEEINRVVADTLSEFLFAPSEDAVENLRREGLAEDRIHLVGNVMIDSLLDSQARADSSSALDRFGLEPGSYFLATLHRPTNVDDPADLARVVDILAGAAGLRPTLLVAHPRTADRLRRSGLGEGLRARGVTVTEPLGYLDFVKLLSSSAAVITDSGGIQEESTVLGVPCITLRDRTERPITVAQGTNRVTGLDLDAVLLAARDALEARPRPQAPPLWDGRASARIVDVLLDRLGAR
jgi:UDP-N-acetylglucosamine 2-epimerase (non-hydrolysing)